MTMETERYKEEQYLKNCVQLIQKNVDSYQAQIKEMTDEIKEMYDRYRGGDEEVFTDLSNTITMNDNMKSSLKKI